MTKASDMLQYIFRRDDGHCMWCNKEVWCPTPENQHGPFTHDMATRDHIITRAEKYVNNRSAVVLCCLECNGKRGSTNIFQWIRRLARKEPDFAIRVLPRFKKIVKEFNEYNFKIITRTPETHPKRWAKIGHQDVYLVDLLRTLETMEEEALFKKVWMKGPEHGIHNEFRRQLANFTPVNLGTLQPVQNAL